MRRVQLPLLLLAAAGLIGLPFLRHARNRLLSGQPVGFGAAVAAAGAGHGGALALAFVLLAAPLARPSSAGLRWVGLLGAGLTLASAAAVAGAAAASLTSAVSPASRTSFGPGAWALAAILLLLASDTARRLGTGVAPGSAPGIAPGLAAAALALGPLAALIAQGDLASLALFKEYAAQRDAFQAALARHALLVAGGLLPALAIGVPLGVAAQRSARMRLLAFPALNLIQTVPSIALFGLLIGPLSTLGALVPGIAGVGLAPALLALTLYSLLPIVRNTAAGLDGVPGAVRLAASGMGMSPAQTFWRIDAPLALPVLLSGLRITAVQAVGLAAVSALIGAGGLGAIIFQGLFANALDLVVLGALPVIALAALCDLLFRALTAWARGALGAAA